MFSFTVFLLCPERADILRSVEAMNVKANAVTVKQF